MWFDKTQKAMKAIISRYIFAAAVMFAGFAMQALDLPIKTVNGHMVYFYKVEKKESVYGIAKRLNLSREEIVRHNPSVNDGVKKGMELYFPVSEYAQINSDELRERAEEIDGDRDRIVDETDPQPAMMQKEPTIALLLPFGQNSRAQMSSLSTSIKASLSVPIHLPGETGT